MKLRYILVIVIIIAAAASISLAQYRYQCKATIQNHVAKFTFPLPAKNEFKWNQQQTKDDSLEYTWQVSLEGSDLKYKYKFGVYLFKFPGAKEIKGSLNKLFKMAQFTVWEINPNSFREDLPIDVHIETDKIVIIVSDKATMKALLSNKPTIAHFMVDTPYSEINFETTAPVGILK